MLDDLFSLIAAGKAKTSEGLRLLSAYKSEDSYIVWNNISSHLSQLATVIADQDCYADFDRSISNLFSTCAGHWTPWAMGMVIAFQVCAGPVQRAEGSDRLGPG